MARYLRFLRSTGGLIAMAAMPAALVVLSSTPAMAASKVHQAARAIEKVQGKLGLRDKPILMAS